jgi:hypothetical protein
MFGLIGSSLVQASNNFDDEYNQGIPVKPASQSWAQYFKEKAYNGAQYLNPWSYGQAANEDATDDMGDMSTNDADSEDEVIVETPVVVVPQVKRPLTRQQEQAPVVDEQRSLMDPESRANSARILANKEDNEHMRRYSEGAEYALSTGNVDQAVEILNDGLLFIEQERNDGKDLPIYEEFARRFRTILDKIS